MQVSAYNILVSGVGAVIGYGVVRSLKASRFAVNVVGTDIHADAAGKHWCDCFEQCPPVAEATYPEFLRDILRRHEVDLVIPAIEQDVAFLASERERGRLKDLTTRFALNDARLLLVANDKWLTHGRLQAHGFPTIPTRIDGSFDELAAEWGLPLLLKPRRSYASKGIQRVRTREEFEHGKATLGDDFMVQRLVGSQDEEFTVGAFGLGGGRCVAPIILERTLSREGATAKASVRELPELDRQVRQLAELFEPIGPTNFQFRRHQGEFLLLEINPRVSSSNSLRTAFGYNEAEMCIEFYLEQKLPAAPRIRSGCAVRYIEDIVVYDRASF
jgi:carbamoyl-phosphate synthase large subunit